MKFSSGLLKSYFESSHETFLLEGSRKSFQPLAIVHLTAGEGGVYGSLLVFHVIFHSVVSLEASAMVRGGRREKDKRMDYLQMLWKGCFSVGILILNGLVCVSTSMRNKQSLLEGLTGERSGPVT